MSRTYTAEKLIKGIKRRASMPTSNSLFSEEDFLGFINSELESLVVPLILKHKQGYFLTYQDIEVNSTDAAYNLPSDSIVMGMRSAVYVDNQGKPQHNLEHLSIEKVSSDDRYCLDAGFYFEGNTIVLYPKPNKARTLRLYYYHTPNEVVLSSKCGQITAIDTNTNEVTLSNIPNDWNTDDVFDVVGSKPGFNLNATGLTASSISSPTITLNSVENLSIGDWVCLEGTSPVPMVPKEAFKIVEQAAAAKCLEALGRSTNTAEGKLQQCMQSFESLISPRSKGKSPVISANGEGIFQNNHNNRRYRRD